MEASASRGFLSKKWSHPSERKQRKKARKKKSNNKKQKPVCTRTNPIYWNELVNTSTQYTQIQFKRNHRTFQYCFFFVLVSISFLLCMVTFISIRQQQYSLVCLSVSSEREWADVRTGKKDKRKIGDWAKKKHRNICTQTHTHTPHKIDAKSSKTLSSWHVNEIEAIGFL